MRSAPSPIQTCFLSLSLLITVSVSPVQAAEPVVEVLIGPETPIVEKNQQSQLKTPFAVEFAANGDMLIVEYDGGRILSWHEGHGLTHLAGDGQSGYVDGPAKTARFNQLHNLAILADGSVLLSDHVNHAVRKYDPNTELVSTVAGNGKPGPMSAKVKAAEATFNQPICVSLTPKKDTLLIADINNRVIRRWDFATGLITIIAGNGTKGVPADGAISVDSPLLDPRGAIENEAGEIYLIERNAHSLRRIDAKGTITTIAGTGKAGDRDGDALMAQLNGPKHLCFGSDGCVFIADDNNHAVRKYDPRTKMLTTVALGEYKLNRPHGVCVHGDWLYIADSFNNRILRVRLQ